MSDPTYKLRWANGQEYGPATMVMLAQWAREGRVPRDAILVPADASSPPMPVTSGPSLAALLGPAAPPVVQGPMTAPPDFTARSSALIPTGNSSALVGYYLAVFSLLAGPVLGIPATILGIIGLKKVRRNPDVKGTAHPIVAIGGGLITTFGCAAFFLVSILRF